MLKNLTEKQKQELKNEVFKELFNTITQDDLVNFNLLTSEQKMEYASQAETILYLPVFKELIKEMKLVSNKRMFEESKCWDDMMFGKACLYIIDVMIKKLINISKFK